MTSLQPDPFPPPWASAWGYERPERYTFEEPLLLPFVEFELAPGVAMRLRWMPPAQSSMGSRKDATGRHGHEGPQRLVTITRGFWLGDAPCTQGQWVAVMGTNPSGFTGKIDSAERPVENVTWYDCQHFCRKLFERYPGLGARLPTEAEWEYACRATTESAFNDGLPYTVPAGNGPALAKLGWFSANSGMETHPVRRLQPNRWGLYDMHGNVWEWCADEIRHVGEERPFYYTMIRDESVLHIQRGGSWADSGSSYARNHRWEDTSDNKSGFRLAAANPPRADQAEPARIGAPLGDPGSALPGAGSARAGASSAPEGWLFALERPA